jgi:hypothetical protein
MTRDVLGEAPTDNGASAFPITLAAIFSFLASFPFVAPWGFVFRMSCTHAFPSGILEDCAPIRV